LRFDDVSGERKTPSIVFCHFKMTYELLSLFVFGGFGSCHEIVEAYFLKVHRYLSNIPKLNLYMFEIAANGVTVVLSVLVMPNLMQSCAIR